MTNGFAADGLADLAEQIDRKVDNLILRMKRGMIVEEEDFSQKLLDAIEGVVTGIGSISSRGRRLGLVSLRICATRSHLGHSKLMAVPFRCTWMAVQRLERAPVPKKRKPALTFSWCWKPMELMDWRP
ncbi:hypothetical protein [Ensifer aridi]|uniref:hypothetical protein n=1 Tax=Ensifer aridi TaxID=1708715 RepID=UPI000A111883|nr:hypothetical protein [Ensifer aridi]